MSTRPKVFVIGLNKTATRSIFMLFKRSGYRGMHYSHGILARDIADSKQTRRPASGAVRRRRRLHGHGGCERPPTGPFEGYAEYAHLDAHYPDAKFVLNIRGLNGWLRSRMLHREGSYFRKWAALYGTDDPIEVMTRWKAQYEDHHDAVRAYFADKPGRLLEFRIGKDDPRALVEFMAPDYELDLSPLGQRDRAPAPGAPEEPASGKGDPAEARRSQGRAQGREGGAPGRKAEAGHGSAAGEPADT